MNLRMNPGVMTLIAFIGLGWAQHPPLLSESVVAALAQEISGETAKRNLEAVTRHHRMRGSRGFRAAAEHIADQLRTYGLSDVEIAQFAADGKTMYGTQKARPAWDAEFAELWELRRTPEGWIRHQRLASWEAMPVTLAQDSESADVTAELIDVGNGTSDGDYEGKEVRGKIVLAAAQPGPVAQLAVARFGAAGIVSYARNQPTAWSVDNDALVRWGHLDSFAETGTFAFMISLQQARALMDRLARGEILQVQAIVRAARHSGFYDVVTATIPGADPNLRDDEIVFSCHLDHQRPGANDNASGCVSILEAARTFSKLIDEGTLPRPPRTLRFVWPPEIEGTLAFLNSRRELAARIKAAIHLDMVGGGPQTNAIFHITRGPASLPSFINDVAEAFGAFVNNQSAEFAGTGRASTPLHAPEGGKNALQAEMAEFTMGSDHQVYTDSSFGIPAIYLNDWPDRYIHTNLDSPANIDVTKLKRASFIGAASGYFLAQASAKDAHPIWNLLRTHSLRRTAVLLQRRARLPQDEAANSTRFHLGYERALVQSMDRFFEIPDSVVQDARVFMTHLERLVGDISAQTEPQGHGRLLFRRSRSVLGPVSVFGYDYLGDHYGVERVDSVRLLRFRGQRAGGGEYAYEVLNFVDGRRTAQEIRDAVSAVYGPIPLELVIEYLRVLETIGLVELIATPE